MVKKNNNKKKQRGMFFLGGVGEGLHCVCIYLYRAGVPRRKQRQFPRGGRLANVQGKGKGKILPPSFLNPAGKARGHTVHRMPTA